MFASILEQSLLFLPFALGIFVSYGVLKIPDLATDGSFVVGGALVGCVVHAGFSPFTSMCIAVCGGAVIGQISCFLQNKLNHNPLLAGILIVFVLNTIILKMMGRPNLSLFDQPSIFDGFSKIFVLFGLSIVLIFALASFLSSRYGLVLHALGNNATLVSLSGSSASRYQGLGLSLSNALVALSGSLTAQANGYVDIQMGYGLVLIGLGTVIIGQKIHQAKAPLNRSQLVKICACLGGVLSYFGLVNLLIYFGLDPIYLRCLIGISLIVFLSSRKKALA